MGTENSTPNSEASNPQNAPGGEQPVADGKYSQEDVQRIVRERIAEEQRALTKKYADYDALKAAAQQLDAIKAEQMSELEKAQKRAQDAEATRDKALQEANARLIRAAFVAEAAKAGAAHPEDAFALADRAGVSIRDDGTVLGASEAVRALVDGGRLVMQARSGAPGLDGGAGGGERTEKIKPLSPEQLAVARKLGLKPEDYAKRLTKEV